MSRHRFSKGQKFVWKGVPYSVLQHRDSKINIEDFSGTIMTVEYGILVQALFSGELRFAIAGKHSKEDSSTGLSTECKYEDWDSCPSHLKEVARYREEAIKPLLLLDPRKRTREHFEARVAELHARQSGEGRRGLLGAVSIVSLYQWLKDFEQSGRDERALIPDFQKCGAKGKSRLAHEVEVIIQAVIDDKYMVPEKVTAEDVHREIAARIAEQNQFSPENLRLRIPSLRTIYRRINELDTVDLYATKHGARAARQKFTQYTQVERDLLPLERVEIDHTILDVIVVDPCDRLPLGRPTITVALDVGTRYPVGFYMGFEPPSYLCVLECLNHAIRPKVDTREKYGTEHPWIAYGVPKCIVVDNGKEFVGRDLDDACRLLGIEMFRTPVAEPHYKGTIERLFRTLNTLIIQKIPGTTFSNPTERGDYDSLKRAVVTLDELESIVYIALLDIYAQRFHRRINDYPARCWERATKAGFSPSLPANIDELSIALGRVTDRTVQHYGIEFEGLVYNGKELSSLRASLSKGERVTVKYHPADISYIYVQDPFSKRYIKLSTALQKYVQGGLSLWRHRAQRKAVLQEQEAIDIQGLARAERKIAAKITDSTRKARLVTRSLKARWEGGRSAANQTAGAGEIAHTNVTETPEFEEPPVGACTTENYYSAGDKPVGDKDEIRFDLPRTDRKKGAVDARKEETGSVQEG